MTTIDAIKQWQAIVGTTVDGQFGPKTKAATISWQTNHGLVADGIVGSKTWTAAGFPNNPTIKMNSVSTQTEPAVPLKAGFLPWLDGIPTWTKLAIGGVVIASLYKAYTKKGIRP